MVKLKLFFMFAIMIFLISCEKINYKSITEQTTEIKEETTEILNQVQGNKEDLNKLKENMTNNTYGIKKETLTISDTFNKIEFKINYPIIYSINKDKIEFYDYISSDILDLIFEEVYGLYYDDYFGNMHSNGINKIINYPKDSIFDYKISYKDDNFLSLDYTWNSIELIEERNFVSSLTINLVMKYDSNNDIYNINKIEKNDIISDKEILEFIQNEDFKESQGVYEIMKPFIEELKKTGNIPSGYYLTDEILLKDNNILGLIIGVPDFQGDICEINIKYNWKEKLLNKYKNE